MSWLRRLPGFKRSAPGLEWAIWRRLPAVWLGGTLLPALMAGTAWLAAPEAPYGAMDRSLTQFYYVLIGVVILHWTLVLTLAIGCVIVILMKGPAFGADGYPLNDSDVPDAAKLKKNAT